MATRVTAAAVQAGWTPATEYVRVSSVAVQVAWRPRLPAGAGSEGEGTEPQTSAQAAQGAPSPTTANAPGAAATSTAPASAAATASRPATGSAPRAGTATIGAPTAQQAASTPSTPSGAASTASTGGATSAAGATTTQAASAAPASMARLGETGAAMTGGGRSSSTTTATGGAPSSRTSSGGRIGFTPAQAGMVAAMQASGAAMGQILPAGANGITIRGEAMKITPAFYNTDFERINPPKLRYEVESYSWNAIGGPEYATINASGAEIPLQFLAQMLRYPVEILDTQGRTVWWGFVHGVELRIRNRVAKLDLSRLWNYITIEYNAIASGSDGTGTRTLTTAASDAISIARYGRRELLQQATDINAAAGAEGRRDELLAYYSLPRVDRESVQRTNTPTATIFCRGWWDTLGWRYFSESDNTDVATTTQISDAVTACGEFITSTIIQDASGISTNPYRDGNDRAQAVIEQLLSVGTTNGRRLLASVNQARALTVYEEDANDPATNYRIDALDILRGPTSQLIPPHTCPVGVWVSDGDGLIGPLDGASLADPGAFFIERSEYDVRSARLNMQPRGALDIFDFVRIMPG